MKAINSQILKLAVPSIFANITVPLVGMVDIAVAGHLSLSGAGGAATAIGAIAVGTMLFDLLYWNFGFLRVGTGGLTAQAFGKGDIRECSKVLCRALSIAFGCALLLIAIQWLFIKAAFLFVDCTQEVEIFAVQYFHIRIWAAPATLALMALKGWFIGMQDSVSPMITDLTVNLMNVAMSIFLSLGAGRWEGMGFSGIAAGTVIAQYSGLLCASILLFFKYRKQLSGTMTSEDFRALFRGGETRQFFVMNADLFVRSLCFIAIYIGFTAISAHYGDLLLAVSSILMKLLMIFSYFTDGFAYAGEALTGKYIGAGDRKMVSQTVKWTFVWSMSIAAGFMVLYQFGGVWLLRLMTSDSEVISMAWDYLPWLLLMPVVGCAAFTWDGIYIGAVASRQMRNSMLWATLGFFLTFSVGILILNASTNSVLAPELSVPAASSGASRHNVIAVHILMAAYFVHLLARTVYLSLKYKKTIRDSTAPS
ncbi:MAG: MATE family efflux transporter [Candidatus Cryptobacteroides sp.]